MAVAKAEQKFNGHEYCRDSQRVEWGSTIATLGVPLTFCRDARAALVLSIWLRLAVRAALIFPFSVCALVRAQTAGSASSWRRRCGRMSSRPATARATAARTAARRGRGAGTPPAPLDRNQNQNQNQSRNRGPTRIRARAEAEPARMAATTLKRRAWTVPPPRLIRVRLRPPPRPNPSPSPSPGPARTRPTAQPAHPPLPRLAL